MDINELILTDEAMKVIDEGVWVGDLDGAPGVELLVTGLRAEAAQKCLNQKQAYYRQRNRGKPLTADQMTRSMGETLAEAVLKDWKGLKSGGKDIPYSREQAEKWLLSRNGDKFAGLVIQAASRVDDEANSFVSGVEKN
ncbi:hypothetical protein IMZ29_00750 [Achromobacter sp. GG226]|uniref:hypothetical protein n=1 Tax=Verticiella alkaliphila TaxID=2779529 RepID=UPI001C0AF6CF|nr:hypothetical protein [Verticiella sp. GG226]MBU4609131.1 hypothetical protein [Verticiella sp. GG226]